MSKILLHYLIPLLLPTVGYLVWNYYLRKRAEANDGEVPELSKGGLFWSMLAGCVLLIVSLVSLAVFTGAPPGEVYQSPRYEDGRIVGPSFEQTPQPAPSN